MKRKDIEAGVAAFVERLGSIVNFSRTLLEVPVVDSFGSSCLLQISQCPTIQSAPATSSSNHGGNPFDRRSTERILPREGVGEDNASVMTVTGYNAGTFVVSTKDMDNDAG